MRAFLAESSGDIGGETRDVWEGVDVWVTDLCTDVGGEVARTPNLDHAAAKVRVSGEART